MTQFPVWRFLSSRVNRMLLALSLCLTWSKYSATSKGTFTVIVPIVCCEVTSVCFYCVVHMQLTQILHISLSWSCYEQRRPFKKLHCLIQTKAAKRWTRLIFWTGNTLQKLIIFIGVVSDWLLIFDIEQWFWNQWVGWTHFQWLCKNN